MTSLLVASVFSIFHLHKTIIFETKLANLRKCFVSVPQTVPISKKPDELKVGKKYTVKTLEALLGIRPYTALEMASKHKNLCRVNSALIRRNFAKYQESLLKTETIMKYPGLLAQTDLDAKLKDLDKLPHDINAVAVLLLLPRLKMQAFIAAEEFLGDAGRISTLAKCLQITEQQACEFLYSKPFLLSMNRDKLESTAILLLDYGIKPQEIWNDLWVLRYSKKLIETRLQEAQDLKMDRLKTWMVRAQPGIFQHYVQRRSDNKTILGENSIAEYLSQRLQCNVEIATYLIAKHPALKNKSLKKLNELINFLFAEGFKPHHIIRVPKILLHSVETTSRRLKILAEKGIEIDSIYMLTKSQKQFTQYYESFLKSKNKTKSID